MFNASNNTDCCIQWRQCSVLLTAANVLCFYSKAGFGPRTAKSQPIWIKFCTHLLLYGIHLWVNLDRNRRVGGSRPNQNDYIFVIIVTHPMDLAIETTDCRDFDGKPSEWKWGRVLSSKIPEFCSVGGARSKTAFSRFNWVPFDYPAHSKPPGNCFTQTNDTDGKRRLEGVPFASLESLWPGIG